MSKFLKGLYTKNPHPNAPNFILGSISIKVEDLIASMKEVVNEKGYINLQAVKSKDGNFQIQIDDWKPTPQGNSAPAPVTPPTDESSLPF